MTIKSFTFNPFQTNSYVCSVGKLAVIVDPANADETEHQEILNYVGDHDLQVERILLTHAHVDHIFGLARLCEEMEVPFWMHRADLPLLDHAAEQARMFGISVEPPPSPGGFLEDGDELKVGANRWTVHHTPGHSPGSVSFYDEAEQVVFAGDVLFASSIGRTDLWQGSLPTLMQSIFQKLVPLGDEVRVFPGHGPTTTVGEERARNPFLTESELRG